MRLTILAISLITLLPMGAFAIFPAPEASHLRLNLRIEDPNFVLQDSQKNLLIRNVQIGFQHWAKHFKSSSEVVGLVKITNLSKSQRVDCASTSSVAVGTFNGISLAEESAAYKIRTGHSARPEAPDLLIQIDPQYLVTDLWLDPQPELRIDPIPDRKIDAISVFIHEFAHAFGFQSYRDKKTGAAEPQWLTLFDQFVKVGSKGFEFHSPSNKLTLTSTSATQNIIHFADETSDVMANDIMNGVGFRYKTRYEISKTDLAVMKDLGLPVTIPD